MPRRGMCAGGPDWPSPEIRPLNQWLIDCPPGLAQGVAIMRCTADITLINDLNAGMLPKVFAAQTIEF